ncbi:DMT family transporter [Nocardioides marmoraquaticus]
MVLPSRARQRSAPRRDGYAASGTLLVAVAGVVWGTIGPTLDVVETRSGLSPWAVTGYRAVVALLVFAAVLLRARVRRRTWSLAHRSSSRVVLIGVLSGVFVSCFSVAVLWVGVTVATILALGWPPVLTQLVHACRTRSLPPRHEVAAVVTALAGLLCVCLGVSSDSGTRPALGVLLALASGTAFALAAESAAALRTEDGASVAIATTTVAALVLVGLGMAGATASDRPLWTDDVVTWLLVVYLGAVTMSLAYIVFFVALRTVDARVAVVATLLEPVVAVLLAVALLGQRLTAATALGVLLILSAVAALGLRSSRGPVRPAAPH